MSTNALPSFPPSYSFSSPPRIATAHKAVKFTYGRTLSSPSEADKSSATLVDIELSPSSKTNGNDISRDQIHSPSSSQETRVDDNEHDNNGHGLVAANRKTLKKFDEFSLFAGNLLSPILHPKDGSISSRRSRSKRITSLTPDPERSECAEEDEKSSEKFQWQWREKLKEIDVEYAQNSPVHAPTTLDVSSAIAPPSPAEYPRQGSPASPTLSKTRLQVSDLDPDSPAIVAGRSRSAQMTMKLGLSSAVDQSEGASSMSDGMQKSRKRSSKGKQKADRTKTKRLTKKEMEEVNREQARLLAEQPSFFPRLQKSRPMIAVSSLAGRIDPTLKSSSKAALQSNTSSDPIQHWSSPTDGASRIGISSRTNTKHDFSAHKSNSATVIKSTAGHLDLVDPESDDGDLPPLGDVLIEQEQKREKEELQKKLADHKKYVLEHQMKIATVERAPASEEDDLEIVEVKRMRGPRVVEGRWKPADTGRPWYGKAGGTKKEGLNKVLLKQSENQRQEVIRKKEEEWTKRGGKIQSGILEDGSHQKAGWVEKLARSRAERDGNEGDEEGSDGEWIPDAPSASSPIHALGENDDDENTLEEEQHPASMAHDSGVETDENEPPTHRRHVRHLRKPKIVDSDDDKPKVLVPDTSVLRFSPPDRLSVSSMDDAVENGTDKENNMDLMFDMSEDKENTLVRSLPLGSQSGAHTRSPLASPRPDERLPFKELCGDEADNDDDWLASAPRLRKGTLSSDGSARHSPLLAPIFTGGDSDGDSSPKPAALGGFSQLFGSGSAARTLSFESPLTQKTHFGLNALRKSDEAAKISLTLDIGLQPALEVSDAIRRKADSIFEREQEDLLEAANVAKAKAKPQLYIDENGFLTQSRPDSSNPEIYRAPATQASTQTQRRPLGTIVVSTSPHISPENVYDGKRKRLKRYSSTSPNQRSGYRSSVSPSPTRRSLDAFDLLRKGATAREKVKKQRGLVASEFVQGEAQESDEDDGFGFVKRDDGDEDEESNAENDKVLEGLVNDAEMDAETEAKQKVVEKFKEHLEEDDINLEKYHRDAAEGKFRTKRRNRGVDFEDSDSDFDDEKARELRRRIAKKRKITDDTLDALAKDEETLPFVQAYENGLKEDDMLPIIADQDALMDDVGEDDENAGPQESVSIHEIREQVRKAVREESIERFDPSNTSWLEDRDEDQGDVRIRTADRKTGTYSRAKGGIDPDQLFHSKRTEEPEFNDRLNTWAKANGRSSSSAFAPSGGSVTARPKVGSMKQKTAGTLRAESERRKTLKPGKSMLSAVSDKRSKFKG